jgi:protein-L-isoaspartate(D-aspartate) O-methyltransferase
VSEILARQLAAQGIRDERVLDAFARLDRRLFVPAWLRAEADGDWPLPIGSGQTISQPWVVAYMTEELALTGTERVLEVGTGSGYQAAVLSLLAREVYSVEIVPELAEAARRVLLDELRLENVHLRGGDGASGWPEAAPFDRIVVTAATPEIAPAWISQLASGGRLILPLGMEGGEQVLRLVTAEPGGVLRGEDLLPVRFVPLTHPGAPRDGVRP